MLTKIAVELKKNRQRSYVFRSCDMRPGKILADDISASILCSVDDWETELDG